jgi:hypothetical protein
MAAGMVAATSGAQTAAAAREPLQINVEPGFGGSMKQDSWFPVKMTITNPGDDVSGDLAVHLTGDGNGGQTVVYAKRIDLPKGSTKSVWFTLPGTTSLNVNNNQIVFYEKGVDKGGRVPFAQGKKAIQANTAWPGTLFVGVVARDPDTLNFLTLLNQRGYQVDTTLLSEDFPWNVTMLDGMDVLVFNDASTDTLTAEHTKDIEAWVEQGGRLVLAGGAGYAKSAAAFGALSPVDVTGTASVGALPSFVQATGKELLMGDRLTVTTATVKTGETVFSESGIPLVVHQPLGAGSVLYFAYDLALEPVASWSGNSLLWEQVLSEELAGRMTNNGGQNYYGDGMWELEQALEWFPQFIPPNYKVLVMLFLLYAVVVAPLLYFVLKKADRREWAWFAIPAIALITSGLFYGAGASGRGSTLAQTLSTSELTGTGAATRTAASSVFVPNGGDYMLGWEGERHLMRNTSYNGGGPSGSQTDLVIHSEQDRTVVEFKDVPFWSVRKIYGAGEKVTDAGMFEYTQSIEALQVTGEVVNRTNHDLYEAGIMYGGQWIRIGTLKRGEKKNYQFGTNGTTNGKDPNIGHQVFPNRGSADDRQRERALLNAFAQSRLNESLSGKEPYFIGFTQYREAAFTIDGEAAATDNTELFAQALKFDYEVGDRVVIPGGAMVPYVERSDVTHMHTYPNGTVEVGSGEMILAYRLPQRQQWRYDLVTLTGTVNTNFTMEIWNEANQAWGPLDGTSLPMELRGDALQAVLTGAGQLRIKVTIAGAGGALAYPQLSAEGAAVR